MSSSSTNPLGTKQPRLTTMASQTATISYTTTTQSGTTGGTAPVTPAVNPNAIQEVQDAFNAAFSRIGGGGGGNPGGGNPGGGGGGGGPPAGGPGGIQQVPGGQAPVLPAADIQIMGTPPCLFTGKREESEEWLDKLRHYYRANAGVPGFKSPICKVALALTFMDGPDVAEWTRSVGAFIDTLNPQTQDYPAVWTTFCNQFLEQFADSQRQQRARNELEGLKMTYPGIDDYISKFESLARLAGYALGNQETINMFIKGLSLGVAEDVLKMHNQLGNYDQIKQWAIDSTKARQLIDVIRAGKGPKANPRTFHNNFIPRQMPRQFQQQQKNQPMQCPQYNSSNAPTWMRNQPVPMDTSACFRTPNNRV